MSASAGRPDDDFFCFASSDEDAIDRQIMRENERTVKPVNLLRPAAVPPKAALPRRKITFSFKTKKSARAKSKNVKAIFMLGSALTRGAAGLYGSDEPLHLIRSVPYLHPQKGERLATEYPYHWVDPTDYQVYKHLTVGVTHAHWQALQAIKTAVSALPKGRQGSAKQKLFHDNAKMFYGF
jgi:hypothetical protein